MKNNVRNTTSDFQKQAKGKKSWQKNYLQQDQPILPLQLPRNQPVNLFFKEDIKIFCFPSRSKKKKKLQKDFFKVNKKKIKTSFQKKLQIEIEN